MEKSQEALIRRSQAGQADAFGELVKSHAGRAYNVSGREGVRLDFADGKHLLIGSQRAEELAAAIQTWWKEPA